MYLLQIASAGKSVFRIGWEFIISHWEVATAFFGGIGAIGTFFYKKFIKYRNWFKAMDLIKLQVPELMARVAKSNDSLDKLMNFIMPNGGSSMSDKLDRMERRGIITQQLAWSMKEYSPDGEFITNENGEWTKANKTFLKLVSASNEDVLGDGWIAYLTNGCREKTVKEYNEAIEQTRGTEVECVLRRDYAGVWNVVLTLQPLRNDGKTIGFTGSIKLKP